MQKANTVRVIAFGIAFLQLGAHRADGQILKPAQQASSADVIREISDPSSGARWLLLRDATHREGPGRLVLSASLSGRQTVRREDTSEFRPVIRAGDRVVVEENTPIVEARLEGVATGAAMAGAALKVRLKIGGRTVDTVAQAPGRAALAPEGRMRP